MVIGDFLARHADERPASEAIVFGEVRLNYGTYHRESDRIAAGLLKMGINRGDRIGVYLPSRPEYLFIYMAAAKIGAITVPVSCRFTPPEIKFVINDAGISLLFMVPGFDGVDFIKNLEQIRPETSCLRRAVLLDGDAAAHDMIPYVHLLREPGDSVAKAGSGVTPDDTALLLYTSGTTGVPKAAMLTHGNLTTYSEGMIASSGIGPGDTLLLNVPLNHSGGAVMAVMSCLNLGNKLVMEESFVPEETLKIIEREKITVIGQVPTQYILELLNPNMAKYDLSSVKIAIVSGQSCPADLIARIRERLGVLPRNAYGLTESSGPITFTRPEHGEAKLLNTAGLPMQGVEIAVMDNLNNPLPGGQIGEIALRGPVLMKGYWNRPEENMVAFDAAGYFHTGDMGMLDVDGFLVLSGRKKEMYIRGGESVYPPEVEDALVRHPAVLAAAVVGRPDAIMGEVGRAYVVPRPGTAFIMEEITEFLSDKLAKYKIPEEIVVRNYLPLDSVGKVRKLDLYEEIKREFKIR
jgi:acyl-CoA synthetase (AMP-forming)/AMP-acid ligase II